MDDKQEGSMRNKPNSPNGVITRETAIILSVAMLVIGFVGGVAFGVIKSSKTSDVKGQISSNPPSDMLQKLEDETARNPKNAAAWIKLGNVFFDSDQYKKAINAYEHSLTIKTDDPNVLTDLGIMYRLNKEPLKAVEAFSKAMVADPVHELSRMNKGIVLMYDLKDEKAAIQAWEELLVLNPLVMFQNGQSLDEVLKHYKEGHENNGKRETNTQ